MKKMIFVSLLLAAFLLSAFSAVPVSDINTDKETDAVTCAIINSIGWAIDKNLDLLYSIIADDSNFVEVHPNNKVVYGIDDFKKAEAFWMDPRFKVIRTKIDGLKITFSKSGDVAWFFCMLDDINEWDGQPASWENTRWTGVLEKREGKWRIVQQHFSFAQDN